MKQRFEIQLQSGGEGGNWVLFTVPFDVQQTFGVKGRVSVTGTINGYPYCTSIFPNGDGTHHMMVNKEMQRGAGARAGDVVRVEMELTQK
jgi:hypothetical protein